MNIFKLIFKPFVFIWSWVTNPLFRSDENFRRWGVKTADITSRCMVCGVELDIPGNSIYEPDWRWDFCPKHPAPELGFGDFPAFHEAGMERHMMKTYGYKKTRREIIALMESSTSKEEWSANCRKVKQLCGGGYPIYWHEDVNMPGGVWSRVSAQW